MKQPVVHEGLTALDRPTVGKVVDPAGEELPPQSRTMIALTAEELDLDGGLADFQKWILNFARNDTGHFHDERCCGRFVTDVAAYFEKVGGVVQDGPEAEKFLTHIKGELSAHFNSKGAVDDFARQASEYIENDGSVGKQVKPTTGSSKNSANASARNKSRRGRKTSGQPGKSRSSVSRGVRKSTGQG